MVSFIYSKSLFVTSIHNITGIVVFVYQCLRFCYMYMYYCLFSINNFLDYLQCHVGDINSMVSSPISYELQSNSTHVCVTCTFLTSSLTSCLIVVHQRISQLNSSGLMNIESSHKFSRSGDIAYGCFSTNLNNRQIGVVNGQLVETQGKYTCT